MSLTEYYIVGGPLVWKFKMLNNLLCRDGIERASDKHDNSQHKAILYHGLRLVLGLIKGKLFHKHKTKKGKYKVHTNLSVCDYIMCRK